MKARGRTELGRIAQWDAAKGLGFVEPEVGGPRLLLRRPDLSGRLRFREPRVGEPVRYRRAEAGPARALQVQALTPAPASHPRRPPPAAPSSARLLVVPAFALLLGAIHLARPLPRPVPLLYGALSMALFIVYGLDKWAAARGRARVAEASLHLIALLGGWPGALLGQHIFRHKTAKPAFLRWTWAMVALNLLLLVGLCTPAWAPWIRWIQALLAR